MRSSKNPPIKPGDVFSNLTIIEKSISGNRGQSRWKCQCLCGNKCVVFQDRLRPGHTKSCGCLGATTASKRCTTHGNRKRSSTSREYRAWCCIKSRCNNPNVHNFSGYGGRGIKICSRWEDSFENFLSDVGLCPTASHSIGRINNDGDYEPSNCSWQTSIEQARNKRNNRLLTYNGRTMCVADWTDETGLSKAVIFNRIYRNWKTERILTTPARRSPIKAL